MSTVTLPKVEFREARPYVAMRKRVTIPFGEVIDPALLPVEDYIKAQGFPEYGPCVFRYNLIDMPRLEVEFGFETPKLLAPKEGLVVSEIPAGTYAFLLHTGHYDDLMEANAVLIGWAAHKGIAWDVEGTGEGDRFAARVETYFDPPVGDPSTWRTEVAIRVRG
jgi:effector-binding domain-containing protein